MHEMRRIDKAMQIEREIDDVLKRAEVCHLALHDQPYPYVVPMNFGYRCTTPADEREPTVKRFLYFHAAVHGRKVDLIRSDPRVAFVVDTDRLLVTGSEACRFTMNYASVMGTGTVRLLETHSEKRSGLNVIMEKYSGRKDWSFADNALDSVLLFVLEVHTVTGKRSPAPKRSQ
jgi:uncharacterized protein